jgi:hypothetical protein
MDPAMFFMRVSSSAHQADTAAREMVDEVSFRVRTA